ncbi:MAG: S8 family serine peptidase [Flavobacteriales bacterium AspAUS03]
MRRITLLAIFFFLSVSFSQAQTSSINEEALKHWHHQDPISTGIYGIGTDKAYDLLKKKKRKPTPIIVAVIDSGIDIDHEDLKNNIWTNPGEIPNNGIDDDNNGYIDDTHGWNFIGGKEADIQYDVSEVIRIVKRFKPLFDSGDYLKDKEMQNRIPDDYKMYLEAKKVYEKKLAKSKKDEANIQHFERLKTALLKGFDETAQQLGNQKLTPEIISSIQEVSRETTLIKISLQQVLTQNGDKLHDKTTQEIKQKIETDFNEFIDQQSKRSQYFYNLHFDPRNIVGDNYEDSNEHYYGNNHVKTPYDFHGTHVAGIIGAVRNNNIGMNGIIDQVKIIPIRAIPDGDERDKDVANAIRYAVDNGAQIINMSFGKSFSPQKSIVDAAVKYARDKGVLMIKAAGNSSENIDKKNDYPTNKDVQGRLINDLWITVGASTYENDQNLPAPFSNYGQKNVDLFAPGLAIYSTIPEDTYRLLPGTSMASPMVAGAAAVLWSYYPKLNAAQVKDLLLRSTNVVNKLVNLPIDIEKSPTKVGQKIKFNQLSKTGGILDLYKTVQLAEKEYETLQKRNSSLP